MMKNRIMEYFIPGFKSLAWVMAATVLCVAVSCRREPIYTQVDKVEVRFDFDLSEADTAMHIKPTKPSLIKVMFYNSDTHDAVSQMYYTPTGGKVSGLLPGSYDVVAYGYTCEYTEISGEKNFNTLRAYTSELSMDTDTLGTVIRMPDHMLAGRKMKVEIPYMSEVDTTIVIRPKMKTILDSYTLQIDSLKGLENVTSVDVYLTGHAQSNMLGTGERSENDVTLHLTCGVDMDRYCLFTKFNTFGKIAGKLGKAFLRIVVTGRGGAVYNFSEDITEQYNNPSHRLKLWFHGEIKPREEGGFDPVVDEWDHEIIDVPLS